MDRIATTFTVFLLFWNYFEVQSLLTRSQLLTNLTNSATYDRCFSADYDKDIPTAVVVQLDVSEVTSIDEQKMEYSVLMFVRMQWEDRRLAFYDIANFTRLELTGDMVDMIWTPDVYASNERKIDSHSFVKHREELAYIDPNGTVSVSMRISMTSYCLMELDKYPFDTQTCTVKLQSYAFTSDKLMLQCSENGVIEKHFEMANYNVEVKECKNEVGKDDRRSLVAGQFSYVSGNVIFRRKPSSYLSMYFFPFVLYFVIALFSFCIKESGTSITLCTSVIMATVLQWIAVYSRLPPVWYFTYLDIWILCHIVFISIILIINVLVNTCGCKGNKDDKEKAKPELRNTAQQTQAKLSSIDESEEGKDELSSIDELEEGKNTAQQTRDELSSIDQSEEGKGNRRRADGYQEGQVNRQGCHWCQEGGKCAWFGVQRKCGRTVWLLIIYGMFVLTIQLFWNDSPLRVPVLICDCLIVIAMIATSYQSYKYLKNRKKQETP